MGTNLLLGGIIDFNNNYLAFGVITVCAICLLMLIANVLRRKIRFLRRSLMPTAVIAGFLGLIIKEIVLVFTQFNIFSVVTLEGIVFHFLSIGFIALCLRDKDDYAKDFDKTAVKGGRVNAFKSGGVIVSTYLFQGIVGIITIMLLAVTFMPDLNMGVGLMLPLGFGQGPSQASNIGGVWDIDGIFSAFKGEGLARNYGITIAGLGFVWASIVGVIMVNSVAKKKGLMINKNEFQKSGELNSHSIEGANEIPLSESIDKFTLQICMVGSVYLVTLGIIVGIEALFNLTGIKTLIDLIPTIWGFSFMISVLVALVAKLIMQKLFRKGIMHRKYPNSYMMNRISGAAFDISITSALCLISVTTLGILWVPVLLISTVGGIGTIFFLRFLCNRVYKGYKDEAFLAMYGMLTGTISNGMILLREIDNEFLTPAADDLVVGSSTGIILGFPLLLLIPIGVADGGANIFWVLGIIFVYMMGLIAFQLGWFSKLFRKLFNKSVKKD